MSIKDVYDDIEIPRPNLKHDWTPNGHKKTDADDSEPEIVMDPLPDQQIPHPNPEIQTPVKLEGYAPAEDFPSRKLKRAVRVRSTLSITSLMDYFVQVGGQDPVWTLLEIQAGHRMKYDAHTGEWYREEFDKPPDFKTRAFAASEIASYIYPKRKSVEVSEKKDEEIKFVVQADNTPLGEMPSEEDIARLRAEKIREMRERELESK